MSKLDCRKRACQNRRSQLPILTSDFRQRESVNSRNATCSRCPGALVSVLSLYYVTCEYTTDRFGRKFECASTGGREVHPAALIFTACAVKTHMRKTGADPCPVEGETEARAQPSVPFSLCRSATTLRIFPVGCYGYVHACREQRRSDNPTLWVVTTTGDQSCRMSHRTSKCERKSGLRSLPAPAYAASWPLVAKIARPKIARPVSTAGENPPGVLFAGRRNRALVFGSSVSPLRFGEA